MPARQIERFNRAAIGATPEPVRPLTEAATGLLTGPGLFALRGVNQFASKRGGDVPLPGAATREELARFGEEQYGRAPLGLLVRESIADPTSYMTFGGGARLAARGAQLAKEGGLVSGPLGKALNVAGEAIKGYDVASGEIPALIGRGVKGVAMKTPAAKWLLAPSARSQTEQAVARGGEAVLAGARGVAESRAARAKAGEQLTGSAVEEFVLPGQIRRQPGKRVWNQVGGRLSDYEDRLLAFGDDATDEAGGARQQAGAMVYAEVQRRKNILEREANTAISEIRTGLNPPDGSEARYLPDEAKALINGEYDKLAEGVLTTIEAGHSSLDEIARMDFPKLSGAENAAIASRMTDTVGAIRNAATEARDIAKALRGKGFVEGEGVFDLADPEELVQAIAAEDNAYNAARKTIDAALAQTGGLAMAGAPERNAAVAKQVNAALEFYRTKAGDLTLLSRPMSARAAAVGQATRQTLANEQDTLTAAAKRVRGDADAIRSIAVPLLAQHYRAQIPGIAAPKLLEAMAGDLTDSTTLLKTLDGMVSAGQAPAQIVNKVRDRVKRWGDVGDPLRERDFFYLMMHDYGKAEALARGEKAPNALLGAYYAATGVWRDTALLSPRFHITNAVYMLWASHKAGYSPAPIVNAWQRNMADVWQQLRTDPETGMKATAKQTLQRIFDEDRTVIRTAKESMPAQADWGFEDEAGNIILDQRLERRNTAGVSGPGGLEGGSSGLRRIVGKGVAGNLASGALGGTIGGVAGALTPAESDEQRRINILKGAAPGALVGAGLPTAIWSSKLLGQVIERGGRMHVYDEAMQRAMLGGGEELAQFMRVHTAKPREAIARPLMRDGAEVRTIEDLLGAGFTMPGAPEGATTLGSFPRGAARRPDEILPEVGPTTTGEPSPFAIFQAADEPTRLALADLASRRQAVEQADAAGEAGAADLRREYERTLASVDAGTRALHEGMRGAPPPAPPVTGPEAMTPEDFAAVGYQRYEEPGRGRPDFTRPQGIYTTPATATSPHADLGGEQFFWRRSPDINVLSVSPAESDDFRWLRGSTWAGSGTVALRDMLGAAEFARLSKLSKTKLRAHIDTLFPGAIEPARYRKGDKQDLIEAWAGLEARKRGYDAIEMIDPTDPAETEFVALTEKAMSEAGRPVDPSTIPPPSPMDDLAAAEALQRKAPSPAPGRPTATFSYPTAPGRDDMKRYIYDPSIVTPRVVLRERPDPRQNYNVLEWDLVKDAPYRDAREIFPEQVTMVQRTGGGRPYEKITHGHEPGILYRGIHSAEMDAIRASGAVQSNGSLNIGEAQEGVTIFTPSAMTAYNYASGFAPMQYQATVGGAPNYIIKVRDPGEALHDLSAVPTNTSNEVALRQPVPIDDIVAVYEVRTGMRDITEPGHEQHNYFQVRQMPPDDLARLLGRPVPPAAPARPNPLIPPSPTGAPGVYADMQAGPTILPGKATDEQMASMLAWLKSKGDRFSPLDVRREALLRGVDQDLAEDWAGEWARRLKVGQDAGIAADNVVNFDYSDTSRLTEFLRRSGIFPFITFPIKALPQVATWMIQDPRLFIAWDRLNNLSEDDIAEAGLNPKFARLARMGTLGDEMAALMLGRPDATLMGQPWSMLIPYAEVGRPPRPAYGETTQQPLEQLLDTAGTFGASLGPVPTLLGRLSGTTPDLGGSLLRTSPYAEALSAGMDPGSGGAAIDPELPIKQGIAAIRGAVTGERTTSLTGLPTKDRYIRQAIAEEALAKTGKPPTGDYKAAMDDPSSAIWKRAQRQVERQMAGQTVLSATLPFRTRALTQAEERVAASQRAEGYTPAELEALAPADRKAAISAAYKRGSEGVSLWGLGSTDEAIAKRQLDGYYREAAKWKRMDPRRRAAARKTYLEEKPQLRRYLAEQNEFG